MVKKKIAGWIVIYRKTINDFEGEKIIKTQKESSSEDFLADRNQSFLPFDINCHYFYIGNKTLMLTREKKWFECKEEKYEPGKINDTCMVCLQNFKTKECIVALNCGHCFHKNCLIQWIVRRASCPLCFQIVVTKTVKTNPKRDSIPSYQILSNHLLKSNFMWMP